MENKLITIIVPVYNGEKYIIETLESCEKQSYKNIEILIIDDCSKDNSVKKIEEYIKNKTRFKLVKNKKNLGMIKNINKGIDIALGEWIISLGQDDILNEKHVEKMLKTIDENTSFVFCESDLIDSNGKKYYISNNKDKIIKKLERIKYNLTKNNQINSCGLMYSKEKALKVGKYPFSEKYPCYGEWLFWLKLLSIGNIKFCQDIKSLYRRHENNMTNTFEQNDIKYLLNSYFWDCREYGIKTFLKDFTIIEKISIKYYFFKKKIKEFKK